MRKKFLRNRVATSKSANASNRKITTQRNLTAPFDSSWSQEASSGQVCSRRSPSSPHTHAPALSSPPPAKQPNNLQLLSSFSTLKTGLSASVSRHAALDTTPSLSQTCSRIPPKREGVETQIRENGKMNAERVSRWKSRFCGYEEFFFFFWFLLANNLIDNY